MFSRSNFFSDSVRTPAGHVQPQSFLCQNRTTIIFAVQCWHSSKNTKIQSSFFPSALYLDHDATPRLRQPLFAMSNFANDLDALHRIFMQVAGSSPLAHAVQSKSHPANPVHTALGEYRGSTASTSCQKSGSPGLMIGASSAARFHPRGRRSIRSGSSDVSSSSWSSIARSFII